MLPDSHVCWFCNRICIFSCIRRTEDSPREAVCTRIKCNRSRPSWDHVRNEDHTLLRDRRFSYRRHFRNSRHLDGSMSDSTKRHSNFVDVVEVTVMVTMNLMLIGRYKSNIHSRLLRDRSSVHSLIILDNVCHFRMVCGLFRSENKIFLVFRWNKEVIFFF